MSTEMETKPESFTITKAGKWDVKLQLVNGDQVIAALRAQGSKKWLKPEDGIKWNNALADARQLLRNDIYSKD